MQQKKVSGIVKLYENCFQNLSLVDHGDLECREATLGLAMACSGLTSVQSAAMIVIRSSLSLWNQFAETQRKFTLEEKCLLRLMFQKRPCDG